MQSVFSPLLTGGSGTLSVTLLLLVVFTHRWVRDYGCDSSEFGWEFATCKLSLFASLSIEIYCFCMIVNRPASPYLYFCLHWLHAFGLCQALSGN